MAVREWRTRITPTCRGAIFRAKRWFYATFYTPQNDPDIKEKSRENWTSLARRLVEESNKKGYSEKAARLTIIYDDEGGLFKPIAATIEIFELRQIDKIEIKI